MDTKNLYGAIPSRAFADARFAASDFRVLGVIALHDQRSLERASGGQGCWAGLKTIKDESGLHQISAVSEAINRLSSWGYIIKETQPQDARRLVLRVVYQENVR